jgi:uncharacterized membrane protein
MAFCAKCGSVVADGAGFCPSCGAAQGSAASAPSPAPAAAASATEAGTSQMEENIAGLLCYVFGWVTGLIFYFIDKRPFVRFHAAQSMVVFGGLAVIYIILGMFLGVSMFTGGFGGFSIGFLLYPLVWLVAVVLWVLLMVKAFQHEKFRVPVAADLAEKIFGVA